MKIEREVPALIVGLIGAALLAACATGTPATSDTAVPVTAVLPTEAPAVSPSASAVIAETSAPTEAPTPRPVKTALEATDPTTVVLASGRPTLVEFFAFW